MENKPWEEAALAAASHSDLYSRRRTATTKEEQNAIAPYEHRAFAREAVQENPALVVPIALAAPIYQASKAIGLESSRSDPSIKQLSETYKGLGEGVQAVAKKPWEEAQEAIGNVVGPVVDAAKKLLPWEEARNYTPTRKAPVSQPKPVPSTDGGWDEINKSYQATQSGRDATRLDILRAELAVEKDPKNIEALKRSIQHYAKSSKGKKDAS